MDKFNFLGFTRYDELPFEKFDDAKFSIYVLDKKWNYMFVNKFVKKNLGDKAKRLKGKNMWKHFPQLGNDAAFNLLRDNTEKGVSINTIVTSPITGKRLNIVGYAMTDCFFFFSSILPSKEELIRELRQEIDAKKKN